MQSLGIDVLFKGTNFLRLLGGLWVALRISLTPSPSALCWASQWECS